MYIVVEEKNGGELQKWGEVVGVRQTTNDQMQRIQPAKSTKMQWTITASN
jgi:hypothetical protein